MMLSIVIPAYNESLNILITIDDLRKSLNSFRVESFEVLVVDDHSNDPTFDKVNSLNEGNIKCIRLSKRSGSHVAVRAGFEHSKGDVILCVSADGQEDPKVLNQMLKKWKEGTQIVWGLRKCRKEPITQKFLALVFYKLLNWLAKRDNSNIDFSRADFYLLDRKVVDAINSCPERNTSLFGLISYLGFKQDYVEYERRERKFGKSNWNLRSKTNLAMDWIIAFSGIPLKFVTIFGICVSFIGFLFAIYVILNGILGNPIIGWSSLMTIVLVLGGLQMMFLGIIGEYLWRNIEESRRRPLFFIEKTTVEED